ncbi:unnamed protein product [Sympodiomycopsis kandeliae]
MAAATERLPTTTKAPPPQQQQQQHEFTSSLPGITDPDIARTRAALAGMGVVSAGVGTPGVASRSAVDPASQREASSSSVSPASSVATSRTATAADSLPISPSPSPGPNSSGSVAGKNEPFKPGHRKRSSSLVVVQKIETSPEELLDQSAGFNANADWVNYKGAWVIHIVLILFGKILIDVVPGMQQDLSWTLVNLGYDVISFIMFHHVTGTPFDSNAGAYDQLTLWEQIDEGAQYTPAKKWLTSVPIGLFLISTHYTRYNLALFVLNFGVTLIVLFPKLPILHRLRFRIFPNSGLHSHYASGGVSPYPSRPNTPAISESHSRVASAY